ncbi:MAG: bifunctional 5,10-methylenetetrahydrofolate dehydrogenase/5,10-methenyltetrahydrofolate cyclohydrolase [Candidatus Paceibacterota bacterium]
MQTKIIDGKKIRDELLQDIKNEVEKLPFVPVFCDILVGEDTVSASYVRIKAKTAESVGIKFRTAEFPSSVTTEELIAEIEALNRVPHMCGIIIQLPLPSHIDKEAVLDAIDPSVDVDCLGARAQALFYNNEPVFSFPTARASMKILDESVPELSGKKIVILGQGMLVGRPVTHLLRTRGYDVETITSVTENPKEILRSADVVISAIGKANFLTADMIQEGAIIIDAGTSEEDGAVVGDVDTNSVMNVAGMLTPSPGGVGPVTVAMLLSNVLLCAQKRNESR